ncbi:hypothetical protein FOZ60_009729 [Perkinsus olseni]|uniref:Uncharacterized protein n=1 Tax=Perkinsus olseni TaxID=32597 RepID=A0A7J6NGT6_PEROL|nr:hypothetical protein FOZ60_009729 [Perkinsus olseni]
MFLPASQVPTQPPNHYQDTAATPCPRFREEEEEVETPDPPHKRARPSQPQHDPLFVIPRSQFDGDNSQLDYNFQQPPLPGGSMNNIDDFHLNDLIPPDLDAPNNLIQWSTTQRNKTMAIIAGYPFYRKGPVNKAKTKVRYACSTPHCKTTVYAQVVQCNGLPVEIFPDITENDVPAHHHSPPLT